MEGGRRIMIKIKHERCRWTSQRGVEFAEITPGIYSRLPKSEGWSDIRWFEVDLAAYDMDLVVQPNKTVPEIAAAAGAEVALNGPFAFITTSNATPIGYRVRDGVLEQQVTSVPQWIDFILMGQEAKIAQLNPDSVEGIKLAFSATSELVRDGKSYVNVYGENTPADVRAGDRPRTALGIKIDGKLLLVVVDGDAGTDAGMTLPELARVMLALGAQAAMNLDGGGSSCLVHNGEEISGNPGDRRLGAAICFKRKTVEPSEPETPDDDPVLVIDPGHGGKDPGGGSNEHWLEKDMVLDISLYQYERFKQLGLTVALTRAEDVYLSPEERTRIVRESGARYCLSNHINAGGGDGLETIHSIYASSVLAAMLAEEIRKEGQNVRRTFTRTLPYDSKKDYYYMHRDTGDVDTTIIEYGFADSKKDDVQQLRENWKEYAEAVVRGFCKQINHPYGAPNAEVDRDPNEPVTWGELDKYLKDKGVL